MSTSLALIPSADESQLNRNAAFLELREMVLNSVASDHSKRNYAKAVDDLFAFCASRPLSRALLMEYRAAMLEKKLSASTVNVRLSAIRKLVGEAQKNGILDADQAAKMTDVPNLRQQGTRLGNWLTRDQAKELLAVPDRSTTKGKRDHCILALLVGCALRRKELSTLTLEDIQLREGRWLIVDLVGKGGRVRTVAIPVWVKNAIDAWQTDGMRRPGRFDTKQARRNSMAKKGTLAKCDELQPSFHGSCRPGDDWNRSGRQVQ
jgi:site-specific recombinase XerD